MDLRYTTWLLYLPYRYCALLKHPEFRLLAASVTYLAFIFPYSSNWPSCSSFQILQLSYFERLIDCLKIVTMCHHIFDSYHLFVSSRECVQLNCNFKIFTFKDTIFSNQVFYLSNSSTYVNNHKICTNGLSIIFKFQT